MSKPNYKQIMAIKQKNEQRIREVCPTMLNESGIYIFHRIDENGFKKYYAGQALHLISRCGQHLSEFDHIALSLKKHGLYSHQNPSGWRIDYYYCHKSMLDEEERRTIRIWHTEKGYIPYNVSIGGQGKDRTDINERKSAKSYRDGLAQGRKSLARELKHIIDTHLEVKVRKDNKITQKALAKFWELLNFENEKGENENENETT